MTPWRARRGGGAIGSLAASYEHEISFFHAGGPVVTPEAVDSSGARAMPITTEQIHAGQAVYTPKMLAI
ncbi:MAG: hypothetical protein CTY36_11335, partial [Methylocystis sp.]